MALLKNYFEGAENEAPVLYAINADMVQDLVEANLGRMLTEKELERMFYAMIEGDAPYMHIMEFIISAAKEAMSDETVDWTGVDKDYDDRKHTHYVGSYSVGER